MKLLTFCLKISHFTSALLFVEFTQCINRASSPEGGVTITGGEPLMQHQFVCALVKELKANGIHVAIETNSSLWRTGSNLEELLSYVDLLITDIKHMDSAMHRKLTGVPLEAVLYGIQWAAEVISKRGHGSIIVRTPIIPEFNSSTDVIAKIASFVSSLPCKGTAM